LPLLLLTSIKKYSLEAKVKYHDLATVIAFLSLSVLSNSAWADIQPRSASQNYSQKSLSNAGNPAAAALIVARKDPHVMTGGSFEIGGGVEYGNLDELFAKIDELSLLFNPPKEGDDGTGSESPPSPENPVRDYQWEDIFVEYPGLEDRLDIIKSKVVTTASLLALITAEGYGKAELTSEASFVLHEDFFGGTLLFGMAFKGNSEAVGIFEEITFDSDFAKEQLKTIPDFDENDPIQELDLSGGISLFYDPANNRVKMSVDNDSLLLVKATKIAQFSLAYSRNVMQSDAGDLYLGVKPTFYRVGLTHTSTRIGEITDTEELFDDIKNANYIYENGFDVDFTDQRHWSLNVELDANAVEDPMHDDYQWFTLTGGYATDSWWLPSARLGFSRNLAGSKLAYLNAGVTVMKFINIDMATTLDTVKLDGSEMLRGANIRLGVQFDY